VCAATIDDQKPQPRQKQGLCKQLREVIAGARSNVSLGEARVLEEHIADYQEVFETKSGDYGHAEKVYHIIDIGYARPIRQSPPRFPLTKQAEVNGMLEDMKGKGVIEESDSPWSFYGARPEGRRQLSLLRRLTQTKWLHEKGLLPAPKDWWHPAHAGRSKLILRTRPEKRVLAGGLAVEGQKEDDTFHWAKDVAIHGYALQDL